MITVIALVLQIFMGLITPAHSEVVIIPAKPDYAPTIILSATGDEDGYWCDAYDRAEDEFTTLFNSYAYKRSSNGRSMINGKFVKMGSN